MRRSLSVFALAACACGEPAALPSNGGDAAPAGAWSLQLLPDTALDEASPVVALELSASDGEPTALPSAIELVEGVPSQVSLNKYEQGETTDALAERVVPTQRFEQANHAELRPKGPLALGQTYTLISDSGVLGVLTIAPRNEPAYLARTWPPPDSAFAVLQAVYCGPTVPGRASDVEMFPPGSQARIAPGLNSAEALSERCVRLIPESYDQEGLMPPLRIGDVALDPTPFANAVPPAFVAERRCDTGEVPLGPGCFAVEGDRGIITGPSGMTFWAISSVAGWHLQVLAADERLVVPSLGALSKPKLDVVVFDLSGRAMTDQVQFRLPEPSARVVINEVMANPKGAEPGEEWVELFNAGAVSAKMSGYRLADSGGEVELPPMLLESGAFVVLAREDYTGRGSGDVTPDGSAVIVRLSQLGKNGLNNSGEELRLLDANDNVVSTFPAVAAARAGTSIVRKHAAVLDDDLSGFGSHAAPGASPGAANEAE